MTDPALCDITQGRLPELPVVAQRRSILEAILGSRQFLLCSKNNIYAYKRIHLHPSTDAHGRRYNGTLSADGSDLREGDASHLIDVREGRRHYPPHLNYSPIIAVSIIIIAVTSPSPPPPPPPSPPSAISTSYLELSAAARLINIYWPSLSKLSLFLHNSR